MKFTYCHCDIHNEWAVKECMFFSYLHGVYRVCHFDIFQKSTATHCSVFSTHITLSTSQCEYVWDIGAITKYRIFRREFGVILGVLLQKGLNHFLNWKWKCAIYTVFYALGYWTPSRIPISLWAKFLKCTIFCSRKMRPCTMDTFLDPLYWVRIPTFFKMPQRLINPCKYAHISASTMS